MPSLSERDLRSVEKLFNAMQPILLRARDPRATQHLQSSPTTSRTGASGIADLSRSTSILSPSAELTEGLSLYSATSRGTSAPPPMTAVATDADAQEKRLWTELGFAIWRVGTQKLHLMNFVALDPLGTLAELACRLADFLRDVYNSSESRFARLLAMAHLSSSHVLTMLQLFCARKTCVAMLNGDVRDGLHLHQSVCQYLSDQGHFRWMSQLYVNFCDEAAERDATMTCMPTVFVMTLREILDCLRVCAEQSKVAAKTMLTAEPVAYATYMLYGLKLRISRGALLRPHESDDVFWTDESHSLGQHTSGDVDEMARVAIESFRAVGIPVKRSSAAIAPSKYFSRIVRGDLLRAAERFQDPASGMDSHERKRAEFMKDIKEMLRATIPDASSVCKPLSPEECEQLKSLSAPLGGSSSALNRGSLSRVQLHQLIAFGRLNCFDEIMHHALDVVVECVRATHSYSHFAIHSTLSSYFELSVRGMQRLADDIHCKCAQEPLVGIGSIHRDEEMDKEIEAISSRFVTPLLALYENVIAVGHVFLAMAESLKLATHESESAAAAGTSGAVRRGSTDDFSLLVAADEAVKSPRDNEQVIEQLQEEREQFMQRLLKDEHTKLMRTIIYTVPSLLRSDPLLFSIMEEMCRLGATGAAETYMGDAATAGTSRQGRHGHGGGLPPLRQQTPNESFQRPDSTAAGLGSSGGRQRFAGNRGAPSTSMALGSFFFGPYQGRMGSSPPSGGGDGVAGGGARRRRPPALTRANRDAPAVPGGSSGSLGAKDTTPSSPARDTNFAKSFFKSFFGRKTPVESSPATHPAQPLENSNSNLDLGHPRPLLAASGGMGSSRPSLSELDTLINDGAGGEDRDMSPPAAASPPLPVASWTDVPSYVTFVRGQVELFLNVMDDARLNVYVRIAAGFVLSSVTFTDANSFDLYEGHVGVRAVMQMMLDALRRAHVCIQGSSASPEGAALGSPFTSCTSRTSHPRGKSEDARLPVTSSLLNNSADTEEFIPSDEVSTVFNTYDALSAPELISLVTKVVRVLKKVYFSIGVTPLTSEAVLLTDLPLAFFAEADESVNKSGQTSAIIADATSGGIVVDNSSAPVTEALPGSPYRPSATTADGHDEGVLSVDLKVKKALEARCFDDVLQLWTHFVDVAVCDDDMDDASFNVLCQIFRRALARGSLPKPARAGGSGASAAGKPLAGELGLGSIAPASGGSMVGHSHNNNAGSTLTVTDVRRAGGGGAGSKASRRPPLTPLANAQAAAGMTGFLSHSFTEDSEAFFHEGYPGSPGSALLHQPDAAGGRGVGGAGDRRTLFASPPGTEMDALNESKTADALIDTFDALVHRRPSLLKPAALQTLFDLFSGHEATLMGIGRHCLITTFDCGEVYDVYAKLMREETDDTLLVQLLGLMARSLQAEDISEERLHERRIRLFKSRCVDELILRLCRTLQDPHLSQLFVKFVPQAFRLLCAFEPSRETSPHLDDTCFLAAVSDAIAKMEGTEYFLIVAQSVIDAATSSFDSVGTYLSGQTAALMTGPLHIMHGKWYAEKQTFLDLVPALAKWTLEHDLGLYQCLAEVITGLLQCTSNVNSARLVEFALTSGLPQWLPYLEMPPESVVQMPLTGDPTYLRRFWTPVLTNAPQRSDIRYAMTGGVRLNIGRWPERGLSITALFKFDALYSTIPLFELQNNETAEMVERPVVVEVVGGDSMQLVHDGYRTTLNENHALQNFRAGKWLPVTLVFSVANTMTAYIGGFLVGTASVPFFSAGSTATVNVGFVNRTVPTSLFSISDIGVWDDELTKSQVEAQLAYMCFTDCHPETARVAEFAIPYTLGRRDAPPPVDDCIAHFVPHEHSDGLLTNLLNTENRYPLLAKIIGRNAVTPQFWVNYYQLFISRGGAHHLLDWLRCSTTCDEVVETLQLLMEAMRRTNSAEMERPFLYLRLAHHLKQVAPLMTTRAWDALLYGATSHVIINDEEHRIVINRYLFEFVLGNMELHNEVDDDVTLYLLERLEKVFNPSTCRYAKHNAHFIYPARFIDRLLNSLVLVANDTSIAVRAATIACAKQVVVSCDMEESLVHCLTSLVALLTPSAITMVSRFTRTMEVALPIVRHVRTSLSVLAAQNLTTLILRSLVECTTSHASFMTAFCRVIDFSWYAVCVSRFADPVAVVYATKLFFEAMQRSPALLEEAVQHQASIVEMLQSHAIHDDLTLFLLSLTIGCSRHVDLLAQNHSLLQQLDGVLNSCTPEPNAVVAPIFVKIFVYHIGAVVRTPHFLPFPINTVHLRHRYNAYRVRKYFRLAFFCSRLMLLINLKRYRTTLRVDLRRLREHGSVPSPPVSRRRPSESAPLDSSLSVLDTPQVLASTASGYGGGVGITVTNATVGGGSMAGAMTPNRSQSTTGFTSPRRSQNHSFTLSFAGGAGMLYTPRLPATAGPGGGGSSGAGGRAPAANVSTQAGFLSVHGAGPTSPSLQSSFTPPIATNASFGSDGGAGSFAHLQLSRSRVRSSKWRRAFAVLRVCVLLWIPIQCRRYRWVFLRKQTVKPEQILQRRHPGTLFALRALRRYSAQPSLFYVLVSSPLETSAIASLLPYISKERLAERTQAWAEYLHKLGPSTLSQAAKSQAQRALGDAGPPLTPAANKLIAESETRSNASDDTMMTSPTSMITQGREPNFGVARPPPVNHTITSSHTALSDKDTSTSATLTNNTTSIGTAAAPMPPGSTQAEARPTAAPPTEDARRLRPRQETPLPSVAASNVSSRVDQDDSGDRSDNSETRSADSAGAAVDLSSRGAPLSSPLLPISEDSFADHPPTVESTAMPDRRMVARPSIQVPSSAPLGESSPTAIGDDSNDGKDGNDATASPRAGDGAHSRTRSRSFSRDSSASSGSSSSSSSSSSRSISSSSSSSGSSSSSSLVATLRDTQTQKTPQTADGTVHSGVDPSRLISESTFIAMTDGREGSQWGPSSEALGADHSHADNSADTGLGLPGMPVGHADVVERVIASLGEGVRQETVSILSSLIRAALNVLPAQRWIGGPSYGSCGGLLFQLMFISSAATSSEDLSATLVRFFLLEVTMCVHEQQITVDPTAMHVGSPLIPSLSNSLVFDSTRNSLSLRGVAAERGGSAAGGHSSPASALNNNSFQSKPLGSATGSHFDAVAVSPRSMVGAGHGATSSSNSDVLLFNVSHFTELVVDMLSINVLDLMTARDYLHSLLVLCHNWPARFVDQLSSQVMRACVAVLNRPSQNDVPVEMIQTIYDLTKIVLRPQWHVKGVIECLLRVLYRVYTAFPPVYMSDEDAQLRKDLVVLIYRHIVQAYTGTKELHTALSVRTLTQRFSLYDTFKSTLLKGTEEEACAAFHAYCESHASAMETLMSGRPRQKADAAFRTTIKIRTEYIKRIKSFSQYYMAEVGMKAGCKPRELVDRYMSQCSSYTASVPRLLEDQLALLPIYNCSLPDTLRTEHFRVYHYMDMSRNFASVPCPVPGKVRVVSRVRRRLRDQQLGKRMAEDERRLVDSPSSQRVPFSRDHGAGGGDAHEAERSVPARRDTVEDEAILPCEPPVASRKASLGATARTRAPPLEEDLELRQAAVCEEQVNHIAALVPAFAVRSRPFYNIADHPAFIDENVVVTPSAVNLLWYLIEPGEVLRFMSNGFRINGLHATPCLILLTNRTLKVISFSRVTEAGDIILCQSNAELVDDDDTKSNASSGVLGEGGSGGADGKSGRTKRKQGFNILSMTKQLQRLLSDGKSAEEREQLARDGTRVAQAVRQSTSKAYSHLYWTYAAHNMRRVRCLRYMHLNTAVLIKMYHDDGVFLSVVDSKQSMNPSVREEFLGVLREVVKPHRCEFVDSSQRATDMRSMLIRWAAGSVSNYEYLSFLNRTAGRTVKDYNQYPVFPWVLADYVSATLDLESSSTFRDFRYPMGAQLDERREMVGELYQNTSEVLDPETGKSYPFHHGTHYSTSGGVLYFMLRTEPFTTFARDFQGGNFDVATRLFDSVAASFRSCELGPADCKELLPEFFYNNNFLQNADHLDFGCKSDGEKVDDVHLPPWAKGSVQVFTAVMRYALESDYVVHNIHHWIDLVFGVRRRGPLAVEHFNTFQRMTYGEEVVLALQQAQTPHDCDVIIAEVDNFGQTPLQLFQERHPSHMELEPVKKTTPKDSVASLLGSGGGVGTGNAAGGSGVTSNPGGVNAGAGGAASTASFSSAELKPAALLKATHSAYGGGSTDGRPGSRNTSLASGNTYTNAFEKEAPKVMLMLVQALSDPITYFELSEPSPSLFHPLPPALVNRFRVKPAVIGFERVETTQKIVCSYPCMVAVGDTRYVMCWYEREGRMRRYNNADGTFISALPFRSPDDRTVRVTAVASSPCESFLAVGVSSGAIYCFYPALRDEAVVQTGSLCFHTHAIRGIAVEASSGRALSYTTDALDYPVVWRVQRCHSEWMQRLDLSLLLPAHESSTETDHDRTVVSAHVDSSSLMSILATPRYLLLFDMNGEPFACGKLPGIVVRRMPPPSSSGGAEADVRGLTPPATMSDKEQARAPIVLEDDDGTLGIAVFPAASPTHAPLKPAPPPEPDMTCITVYNCAEWAAGMQLYVSGHIDGSIGLWRSTRLPPDTVQPGKIAVLAFHNMIIHGDGSAGAVTALWQDRPDVPHFFVGYADGSVKVFSFDEPSAKEEITKSK